MNADSESRQIQEISRRLFRDNGAAGHLVEDESKLRSLLARVAKPDVVFLPGASEIGFMHRKLDGAELYFIANTSNHPIITTAMFRDAKAHAEWWDAFSGRISPVPAVAEIEVSLQPYESRLIVFADSSAGGEEPDSKRKSGSATSQDIDLSSEWKLSFRSTNQSVSMPTLRPWSDEERFRYYSGQGTYTKTLDLAANQVRGNSLTLDFGEGTPVPKPDPLPEFNMRAYLDGPVREAAEVYVNDERVGVVWHPPYEIDITAMVKAGTNELRIVVGNTAINELAGQSVPDYRLLNERYGERFVPQGMDHLQPLPSGLVGRVRLRLSPRN
jgi:hypothetical protein